MNILHLILTFPCYCLGCIVGYCARPALRGFYSGFYCIEVAERSKLTDELQLLVEKHQKECEEYEG